MDRRLEEVLYLMQRIISGKDRFEEQRLKAMDWKYIYESSRKNSLGLFVFDLVRESEFYKEQIEREEEKGFWEEWKAETIWRAAAEYQKQYALKRVLEKAEEKGLTPVVFKGCVLSALYPDFALRISSDSDIYIELEEKEEMVHILSEEGYVIDEEDSKEKVPVFWNEKSGHMIELHTCLWEDYTGAKMQILEAAKLTARDTLIRVPVAEGLQVWTMEPTRHLIYQMFHIIKHFVVKGVGLRYLLDIKVFVDHNIEQIDRGFFWETMEKMEYAAFCERFFEICGKYFQMDTRLLGARRVELTKEQEAIFLTDMMKIGEVIEGRNVSWELLTIMKPYLEGNVQGPMSQAARLRHLFFPGPKELPDHCGYAKRFVWLLPVAWIHKAILFVLRRLFGRRKKMSAQQKIQATQYRLSMLAEMGLLQDNQRERK